MSGPFDKELESIATAHTQDFARKLAHEVANLILRRLGIDQSAVAAPRAAVSSAPPAQAKKKAASPPKSETKAAPAAAPALAPKAAPKKAPAAKAKAKPAAPKRAEGSEDRATVVEKVFRLVASGSGVAVGDVVKATGLERGPATAALKALKEEGRIFMGGNRRFARYAMSLAAAEKASETARKG